MPTIDQPRASQPPSGNLPDELTPRGTVISVDQWYMTRSQRRSDLDPGVLVWRRVKLGFIEETKDTTVVWIYALFSGMVVEH